MPSNGKTSTKTQAKSTETTPNGAVATVRQTAERAVDLPVGAPAPTSIPVRWP